ncbi:TetR/AcrR family transcriptional regulator C-terminal domain-containing protein [Streptomyces geranii]|uniref:TetR/AcrR family transcriptional regulator C-terminal domain-containing protein n=1 Tax=Streptomyces geranii TaxID=2058923 RepID=UPI000D03C863|nr:TetR/AcrR family transcriptional regulator C-terminal domain-containing protein [Streptomyces geranii]
MPRNNLSREQIVRAAVGLLDTVGVDGLSMRQLGNRLGSTAAAVYWHVKDKEEILVLAADAVWGEIRLPDPHESGWRAAVTAMANELHAMTLRHPWLVPAMSCHPLYIPGRAHHDDHLLAVCRAAGFTGREAEQAMKTVLTFVLGTALDANEGGPTESTGGDLAFGLQVILDGLQSRLAVRP